MKVELRTKISNAGPTHNVYCVYVDGVLSRSFDELSDDYALTNAREHQRELEDHGRTDTTHSES